MKIKILKKLTAVLCAATISISIVLPAGAITTTAQLSTSDNQHLASLNNMIQSYLDVIQTMKITISDWSQDTDIQRENKKIALQQIDYTKENLTKINKIISPDIILLQKLNDSLIDLNTQIFELSELAESVKNTNEYGDINSDLIDLNTNTKKIYSDATRYVNDHNNQNNTNHINNFNNMSMINNNMNHINNFGNIGMMNYNMNRINNFNNIDMSISKTNANIATLLAELKKLYFPMNYNNTWISPKNQRIISYASTNDMIALAKQISDMWWSSPNFGLNHIVDSMNQNNSMFDISSDAFVNEANTEIDSMLIKAKSNMPSVDINILEQKFKNIHAGMQSFSNCWLFSSQNVINYYKKFKEGVEPIKKAPANGIVDPLQEPRDIVEQEFINHGSDPALLRKGQHYSHISNYLNKCNISTSSLQLVNRDRTDSKRILMSKIAELLLLKHFKSYESPVIILNQGHYVTISGIDVQSDTALVIDSCHKDLRKISLSKLCIDAAQSLSTDGKSENLVLIFTNMSKLYPENLQYFANKDWQSFKSLELENIFKE